MIAVPVEQLQAFFALCHQRLNDRDVGWEAPIIGSIVIHIAFALSQFDDCPGIDLPEIWEMVAIGFAHVPEDDAIMAETFILVNPRKRIPGEKCSTIVTNILGRADARLQRSLEVVSLILSRTTLENTDLVAYVGVLRACIHNITISPAILKALRFLVTKELTIVGDEISHVRLVYEMARGDAAVRIAAVRLYCRLFGVESQADAIAKLAEKLETDEIQILTRRLLEGATSENMTVPWLSVLIDVAHQVTENPDEYADFFERCRSICRELALAPAHPCCADALAAIAAIL
jgi:hypothetical protein